MCLSVSVSFIHYHALVAVFRNRLTIMLIRMCQKAGIPDNALDQTVKLATTLTQQSPTGGMTCILLPSEEYKSVCVYVCVC